MSSTNLLQELAQQISTGLTIKEKETPKKEIVTKSKKSFKHSSNIILKKGTYKGYLGYVQEFKPQQYEVEMYEQDFISEMEYGKREIGEVYIIWRISNC